MIGKPLTLCFIFPSLGAIIPTHINISVGDQLGTGEDYKVSEILGIVLECRSKGWHTRLQTSKGKGITMQTRCSNTTSDCS